MSRILFPLLIGIAILVALVWSGQGGVGPIIITREGELKLVTRLGDPVNVITEPGWALRIPILDAVKTYDGRRQYLNAKPVEMLIAQGEKLIIDYYAIWRIDDPLEFQRRFPLGKNAETRIQEVVNGIVGARIGGLKLSEMLGRSEVLSQLGSEANEQLAGRGVEVIDVRINRTELPRNAEPAAYAQMREQRRARSREYRVSGERQAREIRATAEREARTVRAEARAFAQVTRGEGDALAARTYSDAYGKDPEFYSFVRSLEAYRNTLGVRTTMVLPPDHEFFRFLGDSGSDDAAAEPTDR